MFSKSIKTFSLHYHELMAVIKKQKKYLMLNDYMLDKVLDKINEKIDTVKLDDTKIMIDTDEKLPVNML